MKKYINSYYTLGTISKKITIIKSQAESSADISTSLTVQPGTYICLGAGSEGWNEGTGSNVDFSGGTKLYSTLINYSTLYVLKFAEEGTLYVNHYRPSGSTGGYCIAKIN